MKHHITTQAKLKKLFILSNILLLVFLLTPQPALASTLFNITHDANNLNEYDSTVTDGGDLSTGTPGLAGSTAKMEALIDDATAIYGQKNQTAPASNQIRYRFYIDPNSLTMGTNEAFKFASSNTSISPWELFDVKLQETTGDYYLNILYFNDSDYLDQDVQMVTDAAHYVEIHVE